MKNKTLKRGKHVYTNTFKKKKCLCIFEDILQVSDVLLTNPKLSNTDFSPLLTFHEKNDVYMLDIENIIYFYYK